MTYSLDLRKHVLLFVEGGSGKAEASRVFGVGRCTVHNWLRRPDLAPTPPGPRRRKLDREALGRHVREHPDALLHERAAHFGVHTSSVGHALGRMGLTRKKKPCATPREAAPSGRPTSGSCG